MFTVYFERGGLCSCLFSYLFREGSMTVPVHPIQYWYISRYVMIQFRYSNEETVLITFQIHLPFRLHDSVWWWWGYYSYYYYYFDVCYCYQRSHSFRSSAYNLILGGTHAGTDTDMFRVHHFIYIFGNIFNFILQIIILTQIVWVDSDTRPIFHPMIWLSVVIIMMQLLLRSTSTNSVSIEILSSKDPTTSDIGSFYWW